MKSKNYYQGKRNEMLEFIPSNVSKILEIGCGCGEFGKAVKEQYDISEYWGIDIDKYSVTEASKVLDKAIKHDFNKKLSELNENYFDCIIFNDALEHLHDPWAVLDYCKSILKSDGYIVCSLPNVRHVTNMLNLIFKKDWEYVDAGTLDKTHYRFFTEKSIYRLFSDCNFKILNMKGINKKRSAKPKMYMLILFLNFLTLFFYRKNKTKLSKFHLDLRFLQFAFLAQIND